jgi:chemotaxis protein CheD
MLPAPDDVLEIFLQPGDFYFGTEKTRIRTLLGSCVAVTAWHPRRRIGGMCHYMLPHRPRPSAHAPLDGRYADEAIVLFLHEIAREGTSPHEYQVKLFGGGRMFGHPAKARSHADISQRNVDYGREVIARHRLPLMAEDLGGAAHRNVVLDLWSGDVWVRRAPAGWAANAK